MRKLPYLLVLLLLSLMLLAAAASAHASGLAVAGVPTALTTPADEEEGEASEGEGEEDEEGEGEDCEVEEDEELCEEELEAEEDEECVIEDASPSVVVLPGSQKVLLTVRYHSFEPTMVTIDARLHGGKGGLHLGSERVRFRNAGAFHDSFGLGHKQIGKALAARQFEVDLHAVGTPADCELHLSTRGSRRAK
jgi:hypothetical protein